MVQCKPSTRVREIADEAAWTDDTLLLVLLDAVDSLCEPEDVIEYCEGVADNEPSAGDR